jgi:hypothetical protein
MFELFRHSANSFDLERTVVVSLLGGVPEDSEQFVKLAEFAIQKSQINNRHCLFARGLAEYREKNYSVALKWFAQSRAANGGEYPVVDAKNNLFEALALYKLGRGDEARQLLTTTSEVVNRAVPDSTFGSWPFGSWHDLLICKIALNEAEEVINGQAQTPIK